MAGCLKAKNIHSETKTSPTPHFQFCSQQAHDGNKPLRQDPKIILSGHESSYKNSPFNHF